MKSKHTIDNLYSTATFQNNIFEIKLRDELFSYFISIINKNFVSFKSFVESTDFNIHDVVHSIVTDTIINIRETDGTYKKIDNALFSTYVYQILRNQMNKFRDKMNSRKVESSFNSLSETHTEKIMENKSMEEYKKDEEVSNMVELLDIIKDFVIHHPKVTALEYNIWLGYYFHANTTEELIEEYKITEDKIKNTKRKIKGLIKDMKPEFL